jgi:hypothetical protein
MYVQYLYLFSIFFGPSSLRRCYQFTTFYFPFIYVVFRAKTEASDRSDELLLLIT